MLGLAALLFLLPAAGADVEEEAEKIPDYFCQDCHAQKTLVKTNADNEIVSLYVNETMLKSSAHATNFCVDCHSDLWISHPYDGIPATRVACDYCHEDEALTYTNSVHGQARKAGKTDAAWCTACHGAHDTISVAQTNSQLFGARMYDTCGFCHEDEAQDLKTSSHGKAWTSGKPGAPNSIHSHSAHRVLSLKQAGPLRVALLICGQCHGSARLNAAFGLPQKRVQTFLESYHGLAAQNGEWRVANCASCHGAHKVLPADDPASLVHPAQLVNTCGKCHPGATANFTAGKIHADPAATDLGSRINRWARRLYQGLIVGLITLMLLHNGLSLVAHFRPKPRLPDLPEPIFTPAQQWQHLVLLTSFLLLAWSGFALQYPNSWLSWTLGADEDLRRGLHRGAGVVLLLLAVGHLGYVGCTNAGRELWRKLRPNRTDWTMLAASLRCLARGLPPPAPAGPFSYVEKFEYWSVLWGTAIMGITGTGLWFQMVATLFVPRWVLDVAMTIHYYEAILACLAIVVWHFYHAILLRRI
jgi:cytochrome b subunit of formate dehydrogenase